MTKEGTPAVLFRNSIDLNRFSNGVSRKIVQSNIDVIIRAAKQLSKIDPSRPPSYKTARLRSLIKQTKESLSTWEKESVDVMIRELEGLAGVQAGFVEDQIAQALPNGVLKTDLNPLGYSVQTVAVSPSFAKAVVTKDPSVLSLKSTGTFDLTAAQGAEVLLPNGETVQKAFRGLASRQATQFNQVVRTGLLSGETTESIVSQLIGNLQFGQGAKTNQQYLLAGKEVLNMASHQIRTVVRTSINQVSNAASQQVYKANEDITEKYKYVSTLDSKTTALCASLDGKEFEYGKGPEPPQHFNCRSTTVAVIDYDALKKMGWDFDVPKEGRRAAAGGMVPANETYGKWLYGQRKAGTKFTPGVRQIEALGKEKAKYFNRLANKYGADNAIKKFVREDGSEVSLFQLKKRYGKPESITVKKKTAPKAKATPVKTKTTGFEKRLVDSNPDDLRKNGQKLIEEVGIKEQIVEMKKSKAKMDKLYDSPDLNLSHTDRFKDWEKAQDNYIKSTEKLKDKFKTLRKRMLETSLSDNQVNDFVGQVKFTGSIRKTDKAILKSHLDEYVRMFNGNGFVPNANGVPPIKKIGKAQRASCEFWEGKITTSKKWDNTWSKSTTFHEITHSVEVANPKLNNFANKWKFDKAFGKAGDKAIKDQTILKKYLDKSGSSPVYGMTEKMNKPVYKLKNITNIRYKDPEVAFVNDYLNPYMGKVYGDYKFPEYGLGNQVFNPSEVLTMSVETFADVDKMVKLYRVHPDLFEVVVGMSRATSL
tara:strand:+ start:59 stop:2344 length:2286 start_codon:yes stop_codon:yes gene_type:complete